MVSNLKKRGIFIMVFLFISLSSANSPPELVEQIPLISFQNESHINAINLNSYFVDPDSDSLQFTHYGTNSIGVAIKEGFVSFLYPGSEDLEEIVTFVADDGEFQTTSNSVRIYVGNDRILPSFSELTKSPNKVYTEEFVEFSALWEDDRELDYFEFSIYQQRNLRDENPSEWKTFQGNLSGTKDYSKVRTKIVAPAGNEVFWKFCAYDKSNNSKCTEEIPLTVSKSEEKKSFFQTEDIEKISSYQISNDKVLTVLTKGESQTKTLKISNTGEDFLEFNFSISGLDNLALISKPNLVLQSGTVGEISIEFLSEKDIMPGEYIGELQIDSAFKTKIPLVVYINSPQFEYSLDLESQLNEYKRGQNATSRLILKSNYGLMVNELKLEYSIKDFEGNIYSIKEEMISVGENFEKDLEILIPENIPSGDYIFFAKVSGEKSYAIDSDFISISKGFNLVETLKDSVKYLVIIFVILIILFIFWRHHLRKKRIEALELYLKFQEMKDCIKDKDYRRAGEIYVSLKKRYGESSSEEQLKNSEELIKNIEELSKRINLDDAPSEKPSVEAKKENSPNVESPNEKNSSDSQKETQDSQNQKTSPIKETKEPIPVKQETKESAPVEQETKEPIPVKQETKEPALVKEEKKEQESNESKNPPQTDLPNKIGEQEKNEPQT